MYKCKGPVYYLVCTMSKVLHWRSMFGQKLAQRLHESCFFHWALKGFQFWALKSPLLYLFLPLQSHIWAHASNYSLKCDIYLFGSSLSTRLPFWYICLLYITMNNANNMIWSSLRWKSRVLVYLIQINDWNKKGTTESSWNWNWDWQNLFTLLTYPMKIF